MTDQSTEPLCVRHTFRTDYHGLREIWYIFSFARLAARNEVTCYRVDLIFLPYALLLRRGFPDQTLRLRTNFNASSTPHCRRSNTLLFQNSNSTHLKNMIGAMGDIPVQWASSFSSSSQRNAICTGRPDMHLCLLRMLYQLQDRVRRSYGKEWGLGAGDGQ